MTDRIDKLLASMLNVSRTQAKSILKKENVTVNGVRVTDPSFRADGENDVIERGGNALCYRKFVYIMMNKPAGVISAARGSEKTVIDLLPADMQKRGLFPAGRLDKDTTGFMLITDDGAFAHDILSPKNHIPKTYIADLDKPFDDALTAQFEKGVILNSSVCMPAQISALDGDRTKAVVTIRQGMYHQIKRMFAAFSITVVGLKRIKMGALSLDRSLAPGECRYITAEELELIKQQI